MLEEEKGYRQCISGYVYMIIWKPLVGHCLQCTIEPTNNVDKNAIVVACAIFHCKEEVVGYEQHEHLHHCIHFCISAPLWSGHLCKLENVSIVEVNIPANFHFHGSEKVIKLAKNNVAKIEETLNETVKHCLKMECIQVSCKKCLTCPIIERVRYHLLRGQF